MSSYSDLAPFFLIKDHVHLRNLTSVFAASITSSLVVPTIRLGEMPDFLTQWESLEWFPENVHVVYDGASADIEGTEEGVKLLSFSEDKAYSLHIHSWDKTYMGSKDKSTCDNLPYPIDILRAEGYTCFSKKDSAVRSYGFLQAQALHIKRKTSKVHVLFTLDDDCRPSKSFEGCSFFKTHIVNLFNFSSWSSTVPGVRVRGIPYYTHGQSMFEAANLQVKLSVGTWEGMPDFDSVQRIGHKELEAAELPLARGAILAHPDVTYPICGMNMAFRADFLPLSLFPPMGDISPYKRFDDIWFGLLAQLVLKYTSGSWCYGSPNLNHQKLSDSMKCLVSEAPGIALNEELWIALKYIAKSKLAGFCSRDVSTACAVMANAMTEYTGLGRISANCSKYINQWGLALSGWLKLVDKYSH